MLPAGRHQLLCKYIISFPLLFFERVNGLCWYCARPGEQAIAYLSAEGITNELRKTLLRPLLRLILKSLLNQPTGRQAPTATQIN